MVSYPSDWKIGKIIDFANITTGYRDVKDRVNHGKYPFFVRSNDIEKIDLYDFDCEAVLTAGDGGIGKIFHYINGKFAAHQRVYVINNFREIDGKFFYYYFSKNFLYEVQKYTAKSTVDSVRMPMIERMEIPIPSIEEQKSIVFALSSFDEHIKNLGKLIEKKKSMRDGAIENLLSGSIRLSNYKDEWVEKPLEEISDIYDGTHQTPTYTLRGIRFVSVENITDIYSSNKYISHSDFIKDFKNKPGKNDVLLTRIGTIGESTVVTTNEEIAYYVSLALLKNIRINSSFLNHYIGTKKFKKELDDRTLHHATPKKINKGDIGKCMVRFPLNEDEQKEIAGLLTSMNDEINDLEKEKNKIIQIREGAMAELLSGYVRIK